MNTNITITNLNKTFNIIQNNLKIGTDKISPNAFYKNKDIEFEKIQYNINNFSFKVSKYRKVLLNKNRIVYIPTITDQIVSYTLKKILDNKFKIKYPNRHLIIENLSQKIEELIITNSKFNFIKLDIKKCFNNISKPLLFKMINNSNLITDNEYYLIKQFLKYQNKGIPQGISLSNFLIEFYLKKFDTDLKRISPKICFYARYVDDIVILFNDFFSYSEQKKITEEIYNILKKYQLKMNLNKSVNIKSFDTPILNYLGYDFLAKENKLQIDICKNKLDLILKKIDFCFSQYLHNKNKILLYQRLRYLLIKNYYKKRKIYTNNRLDVYSKRIKIKIGIFNIYKHADSKNLKNYIKKHISSIIKDPKYANIKSIIIENYLKNNSFDQKYFQHANSKEKCIRQLKLLRIYKPHHENISIESLKKIYLEKVIIKQ